MDNKYYNLASILYSQYLSNKSDLALINKACSVEKLEKLFLYTQIV